MVDIPWQGQSYDDDDGGGGDGDDVRIHCVVWLVYHDKVRAGMISLRGDSIITSKANS